MNRGHKKTLAAAATAGEGRSDSNLPVELPSHDGSVEGSFG